MRIKVNNVFIISYLFIFILNNITDAQSSCDTFKIGYKDIKWNWSFSQLRSYFLNKKYKIEEEKYRLSNGKSAESYYFTFNGYNHYKTNKDFFEYIIEYVNGKMISIKFISHFNWNYNYQMAKNSALDIAQKYSMEKTVDQSVSYGTTNEVWSLECPNFKVLLQLFWDPNIIYDNYSSGEVTRYVAIKIFNGDRRDEYDEIVRLYQKEKQKLREKKVTNEY